jgi:hypothetical protein
MVNYLASSLAQTYWKKVIKIICLEQWQFWQSFAYFGYRIIDTVGK